MSRPPTGELSDDDIDWGGAREPTDEWRATVADGGTAAANRFNGTNPVPLTGSADTDHARRVEQATDRERALRQARRTVDAEERGAVVLPVLETLRDRLARPVPSTRWRINGWQPLETRVMLSAQFKSGKTVLVGNYVRSLVDGDSWLGRDAVEASTGAVVLLDFEMSATQLDAWLRAQCIRRDDRVIVVALRGRAATFNLLDDAIRAEWAERLRAWHATDLILDCLRPVLDALGLDEHREAGRFLVAFDQLLAEAGIGQALVVHHMGHTGERARGDSRLRDWADVEWRIVRRDEDPASARYISAYGRDVDVPESQLIYESLTRHLTIETGSRRDAASREALDAVLTVLEAVESPQSGRAVKEALADSEHPRDAIDAALRLGVRTGALVVQDGPRRSRLYRRSSSVSGSVRSVSEDTPSECPAAYIKPDTRTLVEGLSPSSVPAGHSPAGDPEAAEEPAGRKTAEDEDDGNRY